MKSSRFDPIVLTLGFAFLYIPILLLVIFSFNASKLVTVWGGFSTHWYVQMWHNEGLMDAAWITIRVGILSATIATVLGTLAALALTRFVRFPGRVLFSGMIYAPIVMPEVITGLSMLLLFVAINIDRGFWTVTIAHTTFTMCYVAIVVQSRLVTFDRSLEEAALDLFQFVHRHCAEALGRRARLIAELVHRGSPESAARLSPEGLAEQRQVGYPRRFARLRSTVICDAEMQTGSGGSQLYSGSSPDMAEASQARA